MLREDHAFKIDSDLNTGTSESWIIINKSAQVTEPSNVVMIPINIKCEYKINPIGIDILKPRLSWHLYSSGRHQKQTAYQIIVASSWELLETDTGDTWDSGKVISDQSVNIVYNGVPLKSFFCCYWKVRIWDAEGNLSGYSDPSFWEMGILNSSDWSASWVGLKPEYTPKALGAPENAGLRPPYIRKVFKTSKTVKKARLYITCLGVYEAFLNGKRIGEEFFSPGWTDYNKRVQYRTYNVTDMLIEGQNVIGAVISDGWYAGQICIYGRHHYGEYPLKLFVQLNIEYSDGSMERVVTDETWKSHTGPILYSDILIGEAYDARIDDSTSKTLR